MDTVEITRFRPGIDYDSYAVMSLWVRLQAVLHD